MTPADIASINEKIAALKDSNNGLAQEIFDAMVRGVMVDNRIVLGNVEFWVDAEGPWAGKLSFDKPNSEWDMKALTTDLAEMVRRDMGLF